MKVRIMIVCRKREWIRASKKRIERGDSWKWRAKCLNKETEIEGVEVSDQSTPQLIKRIERIGSQERHESAKLVPQLEEFQ